MGQQKEDGVTEFNESNQQIAEACRVKPRQIIRVMRDLESQGIVKTIWEGRGRMPSKRIIVPKTYNSTSRLGVSLRARSSVIEARSSVMEDTLLYVETYRGGFADAAAPVNQ